jgi:uncharacterized protein YoaH (UPF0181 family)
MLRQAMDPAVSYVRARGGRHEERLLDITERVRDAMEHGVYRGAVVALAATQVRSSHELRHLVSFSEAKGAADQRGSSSTSMRPWTLSPPRCLLRRSFVKPFSLYLGPFANEQRLSCFV